MPGISAVSPPISAQPACSQPRGDALDDVGGDVDVELAAGEVVEEEQRLGALHQDVVDAHRDEVDADGVVAVERERELELGAHAVGAGRPAPVRDSACAISNSAPKPPMPASTSGRIVRLANGLMRSTSASPASMSTPASRYDSEGEGVRSWLVIGGEEVGGSRRAGDRGDRLHRGERSG